MVAKRRRGQPAPAPIRPIARRLEQIRETRGVDTLYDFHKRLEAAGLDVSYSAVRNYHYDRDPPLSYLEKVGEVFKVRLAWLAADDGPMELAESRELEAAWKGWMATPEGEQLTQTLERVPGRMRQSFEAGVTSTFPAYDILPQQARDGILEFFQGRFWDTKTSSRHWDEWADLDIYEGCERVGTVIGRYLSAPFDLFGFDSEVLGPVEWAILIDALLRPAEIIMRSSQLKTGG